MLNVKVGDVVLFHPDQKLQSNPFAREATPAIVSKVVADSHPQAGTDPILNLFVFDNMRGTIYQEKVKRGESGGCWTPKE